MPTKQVKLTMQAVPQSGSTVDLSVSVDGTVRFNHSVTAIGTGDMGITDPHEIVEFDLEVASAQGMSNVADIFLNETHAFSATAGNGLIKIENISVNFNPELTSNVGNLLANVVSSGVDGFLICDITTQPLWDGVADTQIYNIAYNRGPLQITGPGEVLIQSEQTVTFDISVPLYY